jgi:hypothetical protein
MNKPFEQPYDENAQPINHAFEQDRLDDRRPVKTAHEGQIVHDQDRFSNQ